MLSAVKHALVARGADNAATRLALKAFGTVHGLRIRINKVISMQRDRREILLPKSLVHLVPFMTRAFDLYFRSFAGVTVEGNTVLDFSRPALHECLAARAKFWFPSLPEEGA